jgi:ribosomal RNA-processing protein 17
MPSRSNVSLLTQSQKIVAAKKRAKKEQIKEIVFDDNARRCVCHYTTTYSLPLFMNCLNDDMLVHREFLTGFHKRKLEKKEAAKKRAVERQKQEQLETRREVHLPFNLCY